VDLVVGLGGGSGHEPPYNVAAGPYNYSDMTGLNNRVVNPGLQPLKAYWTVIDDCGFDGEIWDRVVWSNSLPSGCTSEVYVRADDNRQALANQMFAVVTNNVSLPNIVGRYIEARVALSRDIASKQPLLYDLTLYGTSSADN
jgi:hypothetical protein